MLNLKYKVIKGVKIAYCIFGEKPIDLVIEMGLGSCVGEWWHIAQKLSERYTVLLYERAGNGSSDVAQAVREPRNIALELYELVMRLPHKDKIIILAHSQGGLYAQQFARLFPQLVERLVLLDPLSANDNSFKTKLTRREYKKSGVDKTLGLYINLILAKLKLGNVIKSYMREAPPFYYYDEFSNDAREYILNNLTKANVYKTAIEEYKNAHIEDNITHLRDKEKFPQIPVYLITHSSEIAINEIMEFGAINYNQAQRIESIWQELMQEYLQFSNTSKLWRARNSSHYIHLMDLELVCEALAY